MARGIIGVALVLVVLTGAARAEIVRWTDERGVVHYSDGLESVPERYRAGAVPLGIRNLPPPAPGERQVLAPEGETIRFTPGRHIHVDVLVNDSVRARLILDTGAGQTMISEHILAAAGVRLSDGRAVRRRGIVPGAYAEAIRVPVSSLAIGTARVERLMVNAYHMGDIDGLLGQDFLSRFNVTIDSERGTVTLKPRR